MLAVVLNNVHIACRQPSLSLSLWGRIADCISSSVIDTGQAFVLQWLIRSWCHWPPLPILDCCKHANAYCTTAVTDTDDLSCRREYCKASCISFRNVVTSGNREEFSNSSSDWMWRDTSFFLLLTFNYK